MVGQDFDSDSVTPAHHAFLAGGIVPWIIVAVLVLGGLVAYVAQVQSRRGRVYRIYIDILSKAQQAASERNENEAVRYMIGLCDAIRNELGLFVLHGELANSLKGFREALYEGPKPPKDKQGAHGATLSGGFTYTDHRLATDEHGAGELEKVKAPNQRAYETAKAFHEYWKQKEARLRELYDLQDRLNR
jgi:hypothetical protein